MAHPPPGRADRPAGKNPAAARRRRLPVWKLGLFATVTAVVFFAILEGILALAHIRPLAETEDPYVGFSSLPLYVEETRDDGTRVMVTARNKLAYFNPQEFTRKKPAGTYRIFCLGGSTTFGHPYDDRTSYVGWLREILADADPSQHWEVINAGGVSYASYREAALVEELARYEPDLFVIYSGHNEFLERRTYGDILEMNPSITWLGSMASRTRTYAVVRSAIETARHDKAREARKRYQMTAEVDALLDASIGPAAYARDDTLRQQVEAHYRFNLARMARIARDHGAGIVYVTPACNLKDCSPFKSQHGSDLSPAEQARCDTLQAQAARARAAGDLDRALALLQQAVQRDPRDAEAEYRLGQVLFALQRYPEAQVCFERARDEDVCPLRNQESMSDIVRAVAGQEHTPLVDFVRIIADSTEAEYGYRIPGEEFFLDHAHPTIEGNRILAVAIGEALEKEGIFKPSPGWESSAVDVARQAIHGRMDASMQATALRNVAWLFNWAGKADEAAKLAQRALALDGKSVESLFVLGSQAAAAGRSDEAIRYYTQALAIDSLQFEARNNLAVELTKRGEWAKALVHYKKLLELRPDVAQLQTNVGSTYLHLGQPEDAVPHYAKAVELRPMDARPHVDLAYSLLLAGRTDESMAEYRKAIEIDPKDAEAHQGLGSALAQKGDSEQALRELAQAIQLQPDDAPAHMMAGLLLAQRGDLQNAKDELERAVRADSTVADAHAYLGRVLAQMGRPEEAMAAFDAALRIDPRHLDALNSRARMLVASGKVPEGVRAYREALRIDPKDTRTLANLAWLLATYPDHKVRDGKEALRLAKLADEQTGHRHPWVLDVLAAAQAESGAYTDAVATAERAAQLAQSSGQVQLAQQLQARVDLYAAGEAYHEPQ